MYIYSFYIYIYIFILIYIYICIYIYTIYTNVYIYTLVHSKLNDIKELFGKSNRSCKREFDLRNINSEATFGEKNPTENDKFLSEIIFCFVKLLQ